ncbi:hypothetical protein CDAR_299141 [Caerostris darwini]|uniref:Uncharacterized protein n=1 Tax=Caerostris darwini TaxID=1538125 RepID=A0AAV4PF73_9ARAC|nr:hypothetical protein CDAR_299141 [Caerostris darwini]
MSIKKYSDNFKLANTKSKSYEIPHFTMDKVLKGKRLLDDLNSLRKSRIDSFNYSDKLKFFSLSAEAHRTIRSEVTDIRKVKAHLLLPQDKQPKVSEVYHLTSQLISLESCLN